MNETCIAVAVLVAVVVAVAVAAVVMCFVRKGQQQRIMGSGAQYSRLLAAQASASQCSAPQFPNASAQNACDSGLFPGFASACDSSKAAGVCANFVCYTQDSKGGWAPSTDIDACTTSTQVENMALPSPKPIPELTGTALAGMSSTTAPGTVYCACGHTPPPPPPPPPPPLLPGCATYINTDASLSISGYTMVPANFTDNTTKMNALLANGDLYGDAFELQCSDVAPAGLTTVSSWFCGNNAQGLQEQVSVCPQAPGETSPCQLTDSCVKCGALFGPPGTKLELEVDNQFKYVSHKFVNTDVPVSSCTAGTVYRGVCIPDTLNNVDVKVDPNLSDATRQFIIALYHGGKAGLPEIDAACMAAYLYEVAQFVTAHRIERVFLSVDSPLPDDAGTPQQNGYFLQPQFIAANFLALLPLGTECGVIAYASPVDSGWNFQSAYPYADTTTFGTQVKATCDAQWQTHPDLFPMFADPNLECFGNVYFDKIIGGDVSVDLASCADFNFPLPTATSATCVTPCEGQVTCYDALKTVTCDSDKVCTDYVSNQCLTYNTHGQVSCEAGNCTMCVDSGDVEYFNTCANCANCCPQAIAPKTIVPVCRGSGGMLDGYVRQLLAPHNAQEGGVFVAPPRGAIDPTPCGCPNIASQIVAYITAVNDAMDRLSAAVNSGKLNRTVNDNKITMIAYDGEDAHENNKQGGQCQFVRMVAELNAGLTVYTQSLGKPVKAQAPAPTSDVNPNVPSSLGHAYSMQTTPYPWVLNPSTGTWPLAPNTSGGLNSMAMPEMYWFMGVEWPCVGSSHQIGKTDGWAHAYPDVCTTAMAYNDAINVAHLDVVKFYMWIRAIQGCAPGSGTGFQAMQANMIAYKDMVWPMISCEGLSAGKPGVLETDSSTPWCLARKANRNGATQQSICGTADMAYVWNDWDTVLQFMNAIYKDCFLNTWGTFTSCALALKPCIALYEVQFINPNWMPNKTFNTPSGPPVSPAQWNASVTTGGQGLLACQGSCTDLAPNCDPAVNQSDVNAVGSCAYELLNSGRSDCVGFQLECSVHSRNFSASALQGTCNVHQPNQSSQPSRPAARTRRRSARDRSATDATCSACDKAKCTPTDDNGCCCKYALECMTSDDCCTAYGFASGCSETCCQAGNDPSKKGTCQTSAALNKCSSGGTCTGTGGDCCPGTNNSCVPYASSDICSPHVTGQTAQVDPYDPYDDTPSCTPPAPTGDCPHGVNCVCKDLYGTGNTDCKLCTVGTDCTQPSDTCVPCDVSPMYPQCNAYCPQ